MAHRYRFLGDIQAAPTFALGTTNRGGADQIITLTEGQSVLWKIQGEECHHGLKTLRLESGAIVEVTDGRGLWSFGELEVVQKGLCYVHAQLPPVSSPLERFEENALEHIHLGAGLNREVQSSPLVHLLLGALRPGEVDELIPPLTELGVCSITIFAQKGTPSWSQKSSVVERWERLIAQALKQCKRSYTPKIQPVGSLEQAIQSLQKHSAIDFDSALKYVLSESATVHLPTALASDVQKRAKNPGEPPFILACGSERGLEGQERAFLSDTGFKEVSLGRGILRAKTAVLLGTGILSVSFL